jgi:hypothetical protein
MLFADVFAEIEQLHRVVFEVFQQLDTFLS